MARMVEAAIITFGAICNSISRSFPHSLGLFPKLCRQLCQLGFEGSVDLSEGQGLAFARADLPSRTSRFGFGFFLRSRCSHPCQHRPVPHFPKLGQKLPGSLEER